MPSRAFRHLVERANVAAKLPLRVRSLLATSNSHATLSRLKWLDFEGAFVTKRLCSIIAMISLALPGPALAKRGNDALSLEALHNYAVCAVNRNSDRAAQLLTMDPQGDAYRQGMRRYAIGHNDCMLGGSEFKFTPLPFAGALAEALIASRYRKRSLADAAAAVPPTGAAYLLQAIGRCVSRADPAAVSQLLATVPGSPEEAAALKPAIARLPTCIPGRLTMTFNPPAVRSILALGAYSLYAAQDSAAK